MSQDPNRPTDDESQMPKQPTRQQAEQGHEESETQLADPASSTEIELADKQENPYSITSPDSSLKPLVDPYEAAQNPEAYKNPPQQKEITTPIASGYNMPPQSGYGYADMPPQSGYEYGSPPPQSGYGPYNDVQPTAGFVFTGTGPGAPGQVALTPLPLRQALQQLFKQYIHILTHPSSRTFDGELRKASWNIVWMQILIMAIGGAVISLIAGLLRLAIFGPTIKSAGTIGASTLQTITTVTSSLAVIAIAPLSFFAGTGIIYLAAKAFRGQGTFLVQSYATLLYQVPLRLISSVLTALFLFIPVAGTYIGYVVAFAIGILEIIMCIFQVKSSHRLSTGRAVGAVLIPYGILLLILVLCGVLLIATIVTTNRLQP